mgnify:CR=1 FL=1
MFCKNCGNEIKDGVSFCGKCGTSTISDNFEQQNTDTTDINSKSDSEQKAEEFANKVGRGCASIYMILIAIGVIGVLIVVIGLIIMGIKHITHGKLDTEEVQEAYLEDYDDMTIGEAFGDYSYFSGISWSENTAQYGAEEIDTIVFSATIEMYDNYSGTYIDEPIAIQFMRDDDYDIEVLRVVGNGSTFFSLYEEAIIESIYQDEVVLVDTNDTFTWGQQ